MSLDLFKVQEEMDAALQKIMKRINEEYLNTDITIHRGKYKGRLGKITSIGIYSNSHRKFQICFQIQPYELERRGNVTVMTDRLLWDQRDARTLWPIEGLDLS